MSEAREYVSCSDELGNIHISEEVLASISAAAVLEMEGVSGLAGNVSNDLTELGKKNLSKGIRVKMQEESVDVDVSVLLTYGHTIPEVGEAIQSAVKSAVESMTGLKVERVNVDVTGIVFPPQP